MTTKSLLASFNRSFWMDLPKSKDLQFLHIVLPKNDSMTPDSDCKCPIVIIGDNCTDLAECECLSGTKFLAAIEICDFMDGTYNIRFKNLTKEMNRSRFHCYYRNNCIQSTKRTYVSSFEINEGNYNFSVWI